MSRAKGAQLIVKMAVRETELLYNPIPCDNENIEDEKKKPAK